MKICPNCGSEVLENAEYCTRCGWHFETNANQNADKTVGEEIQPASIAKENSQSSAAEPSSEQRSLMDAAERPQSTVTQHELKTATDADHSRRADEPLQSAMTPSRDDVSDNQTTAEQRHPLVDDPASGNSKPAKPDQKAAVSAAGEAKVNHESSSFKSRAEARKQSESSTDGDSFELTLDLEHAKQGFKRAWDWLIESLRHPGEYEQPSWRWTGLTIQIIEALLTVVTLSWLVDHLSAKLAQLASGSSIVFHIKAMTTGSFLLLWLLILIAALLMSAVAYVFKRYVNGVKGGDYLDMINRLTWTSNFNVILLLVSLLLASLTGSLGMMTLIGVILLTALGMFVLALADVMLEAGPQKFDRMYGALIVLVINGLIVFAAISIGGRLIKEMIMALMLRLF
ncbi:zinc-ribbon domain-containing protein [Lactobacillus sp. MRS-253-APC-2B]|uniref:zinc-ribbon domain-containing protein n=1 Tax=Lactobacillus sp. MRS-253-APC-2B TaxID=2725305 RepID=UPI00146E2143|nr:zinc-ribbon domain-containing protein [Lactobacillus sp. MRS-253-APC-2B]NME34467.1 zinc-ribbon domain-containing protein [Lactobacillus sp. MRS-253-APC-2B]